MGSAHVCGVVVHNGHLGQFLTVLGGTGLGVVLGSVVLASGVSWPWVACLGAALALISALFVEILQRTRRTGADSICVAAGCLQISEVSGVTAFGMALARPIGGSALSCLGI